MSRSLHQVLPPDHGDRGALAEVAARLDIPAGSLVLADSLAAYVEAGLALRPMVRDAPRQAALTEQYLAPVLPALERLLLGLRARLDPELRGARSSRGGRPYPLGQCLEITEAVEARLTKAAPAWLCEPAAEVWSALRRFRAAGGEMRRVWGDLRGEYFQNALLIGTLYVDVANDTVVPTKPPVEIRPLAEADFQPIADHLHYARIAQRYWGHECLPNHLVPELAPYLPLIQIAPNGSLRLGPTTTPMLTLALASRFRTSEAALAGPPLAAGAVRALHGALEGGPARLAASSEEGRAAALARCSAYRAERRFDCPAAFNRAVVAAQAVNRHLARRLVLRRPAGPPETP